MFTGIIAAIGRIELIKPIDESLQSGVRVTVHAGELDLTDLAIGDSIAIQGACMTVVNKTMSTFEVDVSRESLNHISDLSSIEYVNLEKALRTHDRLGGHLVSGHVDGLGTVSYFSPVGESYELRIIVQRELSRYLAYKSSITVNGVSLTVNTVIDHNDHCEFSINLIPHTVKTTTLHNLKIGKNVNLEVDLIARYVERMLSLPGVTNTK
ncbi:MAG: riboflavin synthase [Burkholderia sp.]|nr:riboflavin synthase [Burkholderia sp.]